MMWILSVILCVYIFLHLDSHDRLWERSWPVSMWGCGSSSLSMKCVRVSVGRTAVCSCGALSKWVSVGISLPLVIHYIIIP